MTAKDKVNAMLRKQLQSQKLVSLRQPPKVKEVEDKIPTDLIARADNMDFLTEMKQLFYGGDKAAQAPYTSVQDELMPHGMPLINFTLTEALVD